MAKGNHAAQKRAEAFIERLAHGASSTRADEVAHDLTEGKVPAREEDRRRGATSLGKVAGRAVGPQMGPHQGKGKQS
jgi:uncharacterized protein YcfJ